MDEGARVSFDAATATVIGALIVQVVLIGNGIANYKREQRSKRADAARDQLRLNTDALENFHWILRQALEYASDADPVLDRQRGPEAWQKMVRKLETARATASREGSRLAVELGLRTRVRAAYDDHQELYRRFARVVVGDRPNRFLPPEKQTAEQILIALRQTSYESAFLAAASNAVQSLQKGRNPETFDGEIQVLRNKVPGGCGQDCASAGWSSDSTAATAPAP
jgi:hypothetical protein